MSPHTPWFVGDDLTPDIVKLEICPTRRRGGGNIHGEQVRAGGGNIHGRGTSQRGGSIHWGVTSKKGVTYHLDQQWGWVMMDIKVSKGLVKPEPRSARTLLRPFFKGSEVQMLIL